MAKKKKRTSSNTITLDNILSVWDSIYINYWKAIAETHFSDHKWNIKGSGILVGRCISHDEKTPSFYINTRKRFAHCFGCGIHYNDPIHLASKLLKRTYEDTALHLINTYGPFKGLTSKVVDKLLAYKHSQEVKKGVAWALKTELIDAVTHYQNGTLEESEFAYAKPTIDMLVKRGVDINAVHLLPIGVIPSPSKFYERLKLYAAKQDTDIINDGQKFLESIIPIGPAVEGRYIGWITFIYYADNNTIGAFKIRKPEDNKQFQFVNDDYTPLGFFGLGIPLFTQLLGDEPESISTSVFATEGEFDTLAIISPQISSGDIKIPSVCFSGNTVLSLDGLQTAGYDTIRYIGDWDQAGNRVLKYKIKETTNLKFLIFNPPKGYGAVGKDIHDAYMALGGEKILEDLLDDNNYCFAPEWCLDQVANELASVDKKDIRKQIDIVSGYTSILSNFAERERFIELVSSTFGVSVDLLRKLSSPDTDEGFIEALSREFEKIYKLIYQEATSSGRKLFAWNTHTRTIQSFDLAKSTQIQSVIKADLGSIVDWVENTIGVPPALQEKFDEKTDEMTGGASRNTRRKFYSTLIENEVIPRLITRNQVPMKTDIEFLGQGVHVPDNHRVYIVNGNFIFAKKIIDDKIQWVELEYPADQEFVFETNGSLQWSATLVDIDTITSYPDNLKLDDYLDRLIEILDYGFRFQNHEEECTYLAAFMIAAPLCDIFEHIPWIFIHGPTNSGKSSLTQVLSSQDIRHRNTCVAEHSISMDSFTAAGIKQLMRGSTLTLVLDEFEVGLNRSKGDPKYYHSQNVLELLRGSISQGVKITMGSRIGTPVSYSLRFPFIASGIHAFHKTEDINRVNIIEMAVNDNNLGRIKVTTPGQLILSKFGPKYIEEMRGMSTLVSIHNIEKIKKAYAKVQQEFMTGSNVAAGTNSRFKQQLLPIIAILAAAGKDYKAFAREYTKIKVDIFQETVQAHEYDAIWERLLHTPVIELPDDQSENKTYTLSQLLQEPDIIRLINLSDTGVYYLDTHDVLAVVWPTVLGGPLLKGSPYARVARPQILRSYVAQDPRVSLFNRSSSKPEILKELRSYAGMVKWSDVSIIHTKHFKTGVTKPVGEEAFENKRMLHHKEIVSNVAEIKDATNDDM